jgi:phage terminase small subunit
MGTLTRDECCQYDRALRQLLPMGHMGEIDLAILTLWAKSYTAAVTAWRDVARRGEIIAGTRRGRERVRNPSVAIARDLSTLANRLATELGATPASRGGIRFPTSVPRSLAELVGDE